MNVLQRLQSLPSPRSWSKEKRSSVETTLTFDSDSSADCMTASLDSPSRVRWRDDALESIREFEYTPPVALRLLILLLAPATRQYELLHLEIDTSTTLGDLLQRLPNLATDPLLAAQTYTALCHQGRECIRACTIEHYGLREGDMLLAVPDGHRPLDVVGVERTILSSKKVRRRLRKAKSSGKALRHVDGI